MTELRRKPEVDYYKVLQVDPDAEFEVIEAAYRALSKKYHPDLNRAPDAMDRMSSINSAYTILSDSSKRRDYNYLRNGGVKPPVSAPPPANPVPKAPPVAAKPSAPRPANNKTTFNPNAGSPAQSARQQASSFRPETTYPKTEVKSEPAARATAGPSYQPTHSRSWWGWWIGGVVLLGILAVGLILSLELLFGNPFKTAFVRQAPAAPITTPARFGPTPVPASTPQPALPTSREGISAFLNTSDLYGNRISDLGLSAPDILQLRVKLAANGGVLNSESQVNQGRPADDLDTLRQAEATAYNLVYSLFGRFTDLNRINLTLLDSQGRPYYRADVPRDAAYTFLAWHGSFTSNDPAEAVKDAKQDRLLMHFGASLDETTRNHLNTPTEANYQAELQSIGLTAFSVTGGSTPVVNYLQNRSQAETAVDFTRILYTLYTRFPNLDRLQITASSSPDKPSKFIDRVTFNQVGLASWSEASYGGASAGGDRQAQSIVAALPGDPATLKPLSVQGQAKYKTPTQVGSWAVVAENVQQYDALSLEGQKLPAGKDRQFVVVRVALRNGSDTQQWFLPGERISLLDTRTSTNQAADPNATLLYILKTPPADDAPPGPLDAGKQTALYAVFNLPANTNLSTYRLQFQIDDKKAVMELT